MAGNRIDTHSVGDLGVALGSCMEKEIFASPAPPWGLEIVACAWMDLEMRLPEQNKWEDLLDSHRSSEHLENEPMKHSL